MPAMQKPKTWPKIRIPRRSRPVLYLIGCLVSLLYVPSASAFLCLARRLPLTPSALLCSLYLLTQRPSMTAAPVHRTYTRSSPGLRRGGSTSTAIVNRRALAAEARAVQGIIPMASGSAAIKAQQWTWGSKDEELAALINVGSLALLLLREI